MKLKQTSRPGLLRPPVGTPPKEQFGTCPECGRRVRVGGPHHNRFILLPHAPLPGGIVSCAGTDTQIDTLDEVPPP